ncbi:MAG: MATE family efflux transporter [Deltaproteobacteria bacterium]|nr:MATE family efflux transporter [Deltaproteobacteria bacterium]
MRNRGLRGLCYAARRFAPTTPLHTETSLRAFMTTDQPLIRTGEVDDELRRSVPAVAEVSSPTPALDKATAALLSGSLWKGVAKFGVPMVGAMALHTTFNLVDIYLISRLPNATESLAAIGVCDMIAALATIVSNGLSSATVAVLSRRLGARDQEGAARATCQSLLVVGALSVVFGVLGFAGAGWITGELMDLRGRTGQLAAEYLAVALGGSFSIFLLLQITSVLRGLGSSKLPAFLLVAGNVLNLVLAVLFVFGPGPVPEPFGVFGPIAEALSIPRMELVGAAWATVIGRTVPCLVGLAALAWRPGRRVLFARYFKPSIDEMVRLLRLGWPSSAQLVVRVAAILVLQAIISREYTTVDDASALAAYGICLRLEMLALFIGLGWGAAASTFVGTNLGAGQPDRAVRAGWIASSYNLVLMIGLTVVFLVMSRSILEFFDPDPRVVSAGQEYLLYVAPTYALVGVGAVLSQALTGAGATMSSFVLDAIVLLGVQIPVALGCAVAFDLPRTVLWSIVAVGNVASVAAYVVWYRRGSFVRTVIR